MDFSRFWINNREYNEKDFFKTVNKEQLKDNPAALSLFMALNFTNDNKLDESELKSFFDKAVRFANRDNNPEFSELEAQDMLNEMTGFGSTLPPFLKDTLKKLDPKEIINFIQTIVETDDSKVVNNLKTMNAINEAQTLMPEKTLPMPRLKSLQQQI